MAEQQYLTLHEVAKEIGLSTAQVTSLVVSGRMWAIQVRGQWRVPRGDLDLYLEHQKAEELSDESPFSPGGPPA